VSILFTAAMTSMIDTTVAPVSCDVRMAVDDALARFVSFKRDAQTRKDVAAVCHTACRRRGQK
jgi:hypothetical protein